jgi:hypothetical protein
LFCPNRNITRTAIEKLYLSESVIPACTVSPCESGNPEAAASETAGFPIKYSGMTNQAFFNGLLGRKVAAKDSLS